MAAVLRGAGESIALVWSGWEGQAQSFIEINGREMADFVNLLVKTAGLEKNKLCLSVELIDKLCLSVDFPLFLLFQFQ